MCGVALSNLCVDMLFGEEKAYQRHCVRTTVLHVLMLAFACSITKFYMQGSCISNRNNNFISSPDCSSNGGAVTDGSSATCRRIFASSAFLHCSSCIP